MIRPLGKNILCAEPPSLIGLVINGVAHPDTYKDPAQELVYIVWAKGPDVDPEIIPGSRIVLDRFKLSAKHAAGPGLWVVSEESVALVIKNESKMDS